MRLFLCAIIFLTSLQCLAEEPSWSWPGYPDESKLGAYLMAKCGYKKAQLEEWTFDQWREVHNKYQNNVRSRSNARLPGPTWPFGGCGESWCMMCLGIHLQTVHNIPYSHLSSIGVSQWRAFHDNIHNGSQIYRIRARESKVVRDTLFAPTPQKIVDEMLKLADVQKDDFLCDVGSGDGRIVIAAAKTYGCEAAGVEIDKDLVATSKKKVEEAGVGDLVQIFHADALKSDFSHSTVVTMYLFPDLMKKLVPNLKKLEPGTRIVTYAHKIPGVPENDSATLEIDGSKHNIYLWVVEPDTFD